jgi:putative transposase
MIITRKIQLLFNEPDKDKRAELWTFLRKLNDDVFHAANMIVNHQFFNEIYKERNVLSKIRAIDNQIKELKATLKTTKEVSEKTVIEDQITILSTEKRSIKQSESQQFTKDFGTSQQNTTYELIGHHFPSMPSYVKAALNQNIFKNFREDLFKVQTGQKSLRSYKKGLPIPFMSDSMRFEQKEDQILIHWVNGIDFILNFGRDKSDNQTIINRVLSKTYKIGNSSIQIKDNKIFLLLVVDIPNDEMQLDKSLSVGVDLGLNVPAYCALSEGYERLALGSRDDFLRVRVQMQERRRRLQKNLKLTQGGKGREKKLKAMERIKEAELNFAKTYNHQISHKIVEFAKKNLAATIKLELLEGFGEDEKNQFVLRNWSYFQLQTMIEYKAQKAGIAVVYIDPYRTSKICAKCNHYEDGQRESQAVFRCKNPACKNHNQEVNADYNGALNIAKSTKFVNSKEDCEYYKKIQEEK